MKQWTVVVFAEGEDGMTIFLGKGSFEADTQSQAEWLAEEEFWDDRLDSASCSMLVKSFKEQ